MNSEYYIVRIKDYNVDRIHAQYTVDTSEMQLPEIIAQAKRIMRDYNAPVLCIYDDSNKLVHQFTHGSYKSATR